MENDRLGSSKSECQQKLKLVLTADNCEGSEYFCGEAFHVFQDKHYRRNRGVANGKVIFPTWIVSVCCLIVIYTKWEGNPLTVFHFLGKRPGHFSPLWILHL